MKKINFRQPKYIFPAVIFVPLCALIYFAMETFGGGGDDPQTVATDRINSTLPEANAEAPGDKMFEMSRRFGDEDAFTAVGALGEEQEDREALEHGYTEDELNRLDAAEAERIRQQQELEELERSLAESRRHINSYATATAIILPTMNLPLTPGANMHATLRRYSSAAMSVRKLSRPDLA